MLHIETEVNHAVEEYYVIYDLCRTTYSCGYKIICPRLLYSKVHDSKKRLTYSASVGVKMRNTSFLGIH